MRHPRQHCELFPVFSSPLIEGLPNEDVRKSLFWYFLQCIIVEVSVQEQSYRLTVPIKTDLGDEEIDTSSDNLIGG